MTSLKNFTKEIEIWEGWRNQYKEFVPLFIEEASKGKAWEDWDNDVFIEYFEKSRNQCVSSLQQGYFTRDEQESIKANWMEIAPFIQEISLSQDYPLFDVYYKIKQIIRKYTKVDRKAATNRLIAALQPNLLSTIVNEDNISQFINLLSENIEECSIPVTGDWFTNSNNLWKFYLENLDSNSPYENVTLPWQTYELLLESRNTTNEMSEIKDIENESTKVLEYKKQIILQGPPGTGKTREAELIAKEMLGLSDIKELENNDQYKLVQFHPSYTYEDFVRGIVAVPIGTSVIYESANKILGKFAKDALSNYTNSKKSLELISKESWVSEKYELFKDSLRTILEDSSEVIIKNGIKPKIIAVEDDSLRVNRYSNENDSILVKDNDIILAYIGLELSPELIKIRENSNLSKSARSGMSYVYQNLFAKFRDFLNQNSYNYTPSLNLKTEQLRKYIFIIDEINRANLSSVLGELIYALEYRGKEVESMYEMEGSQKLILPPNLYIIGTMNTADRSVGHIDYAIRRRFAFVDVLPEELKDDKIVFQKELFKKVSALFINNYEEYIADKKIKLEQAKTLSAEFRPEDVWLGHSYFIQTKEKDKDGKDILVPEDFNIRLEYEIKPILIEYVKDGILINTIKEGDKEIKVEDYIKAL